MGKMEVTSMSSRGQVVIPLDIRERLNLHEGEKFIVVGENDTVVLKRLETPTFNGFDKLLKQTRNLVEKKGIKPSDVEKAIREVRQK